MTSNSIKDSNRAFETAKLTTYWLYLARVPEALDFGRLIGLDKMDVSQIPNSDEMCRLNPIVHEIRYKSINHYIRTSGCKHVLDIACGYSPRGLQLACEGYNYHGADLPTVAHDLAPIARATGLKNYKYHAVDATNYESLRKITDEIHEPICICVEGLEMYLTATEVATVRKNIARIMHEHPGSVFVTTDPGNGNILANAVMALYGFWQFMPTIGMVFEMYNWASDGGITMQTAPKTLSGEIRHMREAGLDAKRCALLPTNTELLSTLRLSNSTAKKVKKLTRKTFIFVSKLTENAKEANNSTRETTGEMHNEIPDETLNKASTTPLYKTPSETSNKTPCEPLSNPEKFSLDYSVNGNILKMVLVGRIDSLSAPEILECFKNARSQHQSEQVQRVEIDMKNVTYVSSAGSRVIYLMAKELGGENFVTVKNTNRRVTKTLQNSEIIERR